MLKVMKVKRLSEEEAAAVKLLRHRLTITRQEILALELAITIIEKDDSGDDPQGQQLRQSGT